MTTERIKEIAREKYGKNLTDEQAAEYAEKYGKLSDNELDSVSGGSCLFETDKECPQCGTAMKRNGDTLGWDCGACNYREYPDSGMITVH